MNTICKPGHLRRSFLLALAVVWGTSAFGQYTLTAQSAAGNCGQANIDVSISVNSATGMMAFQFNLYYDPSLLLAVSGASSPLISGWAFAANTSFTDHVAVAAAGMPLAGGAGAVCTVRFNVLPSAADSSSSVLDLQNILINDIASQGTDGSFTIQCAKPCAGSPNPTNSAAGVPLNQLLSWGAVAWATNYDVYFGTTLPFTPIANVVETTFDPGPLANNTTYSWKIAPRDSVGPATGCPTWTFSTVSDNTVFVAAAARTTGASDSNWVTDTMIFNATDAAVPYHLLFTPGGQDGTATPYNYPGTAQAGQSVMNLNLLETLYGLTDTAGSLRLEADAPLHFTSRTYNLTDTGTYGQFIAGAHADEALGGATLRVGEKGQLLGIQQSDTYRTNVGVSEVMGLETAFTVRFYSAAGSMVKSSTGTVKPYSWWQKNLSELGVTTGDNLRAEVEVNSGGIILAYASVVDAKTNDAFYIPAQKVTDLNGVTHQLVAAIAKAKGGLDTDWRSDVYLYNPATAAQTATLQFYSNAGLATNSVPVPAGNNVALKDIVSQLFSQLTGDVAGSLHLSSTQGLMAISRTFNLTADGTYGQFIPARSGGDLLGVNAIGHILQLASNTAYRCNLGFSEYAGVATQVQLTIYNTNGQQLGTGTFQVAAYSNLQLNEVFDVLNIPGNVDAARAQVKVISGGSIYAYASVVDNRTGDAIFIPAQQ